jgi:hypothetical protein
VEVLDEIIRFTQEYPEFGFAVEPTDQMPIRCDHQFDQSWSCPVFVQDAAKDCTKMITDLDGS